VDRPVGSGPPAVWIITPSLHREGGTERAVAEQVERWRGRFNLSLYTMEARGVDLLGVRVRCIWRLPGPHLVRYAWWLVANRVVRAFDSLRLGRPDVVHSPGVNALDAGAVGVHIVFSKHQAALRSRSEAPPPLRALPRRWHRRMYWALVRLLERRVYGGGASLWALSSRDAAWIEREFVRPPGSVPVVPYGVDAQRFCPEAVAARRDAARARLGVEGRRVLLLIGNDWLKKGLDRAVRSLALLPSEYCLAVAGEDERSPFERIGRELGVGSRVAFWPRVPDVMDYYAAADLLLAPSREDSFHLPVLEAFACGLPVVASAEVGSAELEGAAEAALIVPHADRADMLAGAVRSVVAEPEDQRARRRSAGRALAERCSWSAYAERTAALVVSELSGLRVLVLATDAWGRGGIERVTRSLIRALSERYGAERTGLLSIWGADSAQPLPSCRVLYAGGARPGPGPARVGLAARLRFALAALEAARRWRHPRLVVIACHAHLAPVAWLCRLAWGAPYAVWGHGTEVWGGIRLSVRAALARARKVFVPSRYTAAALSTAVPELPVPPEVLPHGLTDEIRLQGDGPVGRNAAQVLTVARLNRADAYKGVDTLLLAWPQVLARAPQAQLVVVGDGDDRARLERLGRHLAVEGTVRFAGRVPDSTLARLYREAALFALPGRARLGPRPEGEGFGMVFLEAAASGLPCVAGRAGGAVEVVEHEVTGLLVDPESPRAVADAIVLLLRDGALAERLGEAGRRRADVEFGFAPYAERLCSVAASLTVG
jgi:phosphatidylinositol alpha-1,6-mannosyltransferase